ncbi:MAG TPA: ABC transporter substrate-binding protein [Thermodesulfobacteriota bacterium]
MLSRRAWLLVLATTLLLAVSSTGHAASFTPDPVDWAAAKKEGTVSWYTSTPIEAAQRIAKLFEQETGIRVELFRSGGTAVLRRFNQELSAGRIAADVITASDPAEAEALARRGVLVPFRPKNFDKVFDYAKHPEGYYIAQRMNLLGIIVREDKVSPADMPKNWTDLTDPKYKGKMVMPDPSFTALQLMAVGTLSRKYGWDFYQKLKANDIMIVQGHQQVSDTLKRGERVIAAEGSDSYAYDDRKAGHKIKTILPSDGAFAIPSPTAIVKGSPHPNAAKAFAEFMIGDGAQAILTEWGNYSSRADVKPPVGYEALTTVKVLEVDYDYLEKESANIKQKFNEIYQ